MVYVKQIEIVNFGPIERTSLKDLKAVNIIVGPNNCGKTHILKAVEILSMDFPISSVPFRRAGKHRVELTYHFDNGKKLRLIDDAERSILVAGTDDSDILSTLKDKILFCDDQRCSTATEYVKGSPEVLESIEEDIKPVDPNFIGFEIKRHAKKSTFFRKCGKDEEEEFEFEEQGSGIKFVVGLFARIAENADKEIILIDEPELGLHPAAKVYLFEQIKRLAENGKQIFVVTHDPFFASPQLLDEGLCSVYVYSFCENQFIRIDPSELKHGHSFVGFFPHNLSMKDIHIYVEGPSDVYALQGFLLAYLRKKGLSMIDFDRVGVFHLGGDKYAHLFYTIPKVPRSIVIFDGNKKDEQKLERVKNNLNTLRESLGDRATFPEFVLCKDEGMEDRLEKARNALDQGKCPVFFLEKDDISEYFGLGDTKPKPVDIAREAIRVENVPVEFEKVFDLIFQTKIELELVARENLLDDWLHGWVNLSGGAVEVCEFDGKKYLKKTRNAEPAGAYKLLSREVNRNEGKIVFKGKVYSPYNRVAFGDRLILEDAVGNGYGLFVFHGKYVAIELRRVGRASEDLAKETYKDLRDKWYEFELTIDGSRISLVISVEGIKMFELHAEDDTYDKFERVAIRGGYNYFVSDLSVYVE